MYCEVKAEIFYNYLLLKVYFSRHEQRRVRQLKLGAHPDSGCAFGVYARDTGRTIIIYLFQVFILRMLGKRMNTQLTLTEMAALVSLAAAIGVQRVISIRSGNSPKF
jgi:hypothetical protein